MSAVAFVCIWLCQLVTCLICFTFICLGLNIYQALASPPVVFLSADCAPPAKESGRIGVLLGIGGLSLLEFILDDCFLRETYILS